MNDRDTTKFLKKHKRGGMNSILQLKKQRRTL